MFVNKAVYEELDEHTKRCLHSSAGIAERRGNEKAIKMTTWYIDQLLANGLNVVQPGDVFREELAQIGATLTDEWSASAGPVGENILREFSAIKGGK